MFNPLKALKKYLLVDKLESDLMFTNERRVFWTKKASEYDVTPKVIYQRLINIHYKRKAIANALRKLHNL